jgi:hypothetical protein
MDVDDVISFEALIYQVGQNRCVDVPADAVEGRGEITIPVILTIGGRSVSTNLLPRGDARFRVFIDSNLREAAGADTGDAIEVEIRLDLSNREPDVPPMLLSFLEGEAGALAAFNGLTVNKRREMVRFVLDAKRAEARARRVARVMEVLQEMKDKTG